MSEWEEWGPWIEHDGKGCPCVWQYVRVKFEDGPVMEGIAGSSGDDASQDGFDPLVGWKWAVVPTENEYFVCAKVIAYCIRKPRGVRLIEEVLAEVSAPGLEAAD